MSLKKILILPVGFILVHILYIGCCKCLQGIYHREISSLNAFETSHSNLNIKDTIYVVDTLFSSIVVRYEYVAKNVSNPFSQVVNSAYATTCSGCENFMDSGFKYKLDSLVISSDAEFKGIPAGQNIGAYFTGVYYSYSNGTGTVSYLPIPQLTDSLNAVKNYSQINLITTASGLAVKIHRLKYTLYSNGKSYEGLSKQLIKWP